MEVKQLKTTRRGLSLAAAFAGILFAATASPQQASEEENSVRSSPKDLTEYARPAGASDLRHGRIHPKVFIRDVVVSNTDPTLSATDTLNDGETSITVTLLTSIAGRRPTLRTLRTGTGSPPAERQRAPTSSRPT